MTAIAKVLNNKILELYEQTWLDSDSMPKNLSEENNVSQYLQDTKPDICSHPVESIEDQ